MLNDEIKIQRYITNERHHPVSLFYLTEFYEPTYRGVSDLDWLLNVTLNTYA